MLKKGDRFRLNPFRRFSPWKLFRGWWEGKEWIFVGLIGLLALVFGFHGYSMALRGTQGDHSVYSTIYWTLQLFTGQEGFTPPHYSWELQSARFMALFVLFYAAVRTIAAVLRQQFENIKIYWSRNHVIICGLGQEGLILTSRFREDGWRVVVIDMDESNGWHTQCRGMGALVLVGNAADRRILEKARVDRAKYVISVCGDDGANCQVAMCARKLLPERRKRPLTCVAHIRNQDLHNLLKEQEIMMSNDDNFRLEFFNVYQNAVRALLVDHPVWNDDNPFPHILIAGWGGLIESFLVQVAQGRNAVNLLNPEDVGENIAGERLCLTVVDSTASEKVELLYCRYPQLVNYFDILPCDMDFGSAEFQRGEFLDNIGRRAGISKAYVFIDDDSLAVSVALQIVNKLKNIPVVVCLNNVDGMGMLISNADRTVNSLKYLKAFGILNNSCAIEMLLDNTHELLARSIHEEYVREQTAKGDTPQTNSSLLSWNDLPEQLKESNRQQADDLGRKLETVNCGISPVHDWNAGTFQFTEDEIQLLAQHEHDRWVKERKKEGWRYSSSPKDLKRKTNPCLVPWEQLPSEEQAKDLNTVRSMPRFLAHAGFEIYRL